MPTRDQLTQERVDALLTELGEAGIITTDESDGLRVTRDFQEARQVQRETPEPPAVTRAKVSGDAHREYAAARREGDVQAQMDVIFHIVTGRDPRSGDEEVSRWRRLGRWFEYALSAP